MCAALFTSHGWTAIIRPLNNFEQRLTKFPDFAFGGDDVFTHRGGWEDFFVRRIGPAFGRRVILDLGCADAAFLGQVAARHPAVGFVGLDWKFKSLYTGAQRIAELGLKNVALLRGRAQDLRRIFAPAELDQIWVFHPEPCDEPAQLKNRLIAGPFLADAHHVLRDAKSMVAVKTDHRGYYEWMLGLFAAEAAEASKLAPAHQFTVSGISLDYWGDEAIRAQTANRCFADAVTTYEARFVTKRRPIYYVELRKRAIGSGKNFPDAGSAGWQQSSCDFEASA